MRHNQIILEIYDYLLAQQNHRGFVVLNRRKLAQDLNVSYERVSRIIRRFRQAGWLSENADDSGVYTLRTHVTELMRHQGGAMTSVSEQAPSAAEGTSVPPSAGSDTRDGGMQAAMAAMVNQAYTAESVAAMAPSETVAEAATLQDLQAQLQDLKSQIQQLGEQLRWQQVHCVALDALPQQLGDLRADLRAVRGSLSGLPQQLEDNTAALQDLSARVAGMADDFQQAQAFMHTAERLLHDLASGQRFIHSMLCKVQDSVQQQPAQQDKTSSTQRCDAVSHDHKVQPA